MTEIEVDDTNPYTETVCALSIYSKNDFNKSDKEMIKQIAVCMKNKELFDSFNELFNKMNISDCFLTSCKENSKYEFIKNIVEYLLSIGDCNRRLAIMWKAGDVFDYLTANNI